MLSQKYQKKKKKNPHFFLKKKKKKKRLLGKSGIYHSSTWHNPETSVMWDAPIKKEPQGPPTLPPFSGSKRASETLNSSIKQVALLGSASEFF